MLTRLRLLLAGWIAGPDYAVIADDELAGLWAFAAGRDPEGYLVDEEGYVIGHVELDRAGN